MSIDRTCSTGSTDSDYTTNLSISGMNPELEVLAEAMEHELREQNLVKNRQTSVIGVGKPIPKAFTGKDAVSVLQQILQEILDKDHTDQGIPLGFINRQVALERGQEIMAEFSSFKHATKEGTPLQDSAGALYQFDHNLPCQVYKVKKQYKSYWDKMRLLEEHVQVKDYRHRFMVFLNCFTASEAVDALMELKLVKSRGEAVHLIRQLNRKVHCCRPVVPAERQQQPEFKDSTNLLLEFVPKAERIPEPPVRKSSRNNSSKRAPASPKRSKKIVMTDGSRSSSGRTHRSRSHSPKRSEQEVREANQRQANDIKDRLAIHKEQVMKQQQQKAVEMKSPLALKRLEDTVKNVSAANSAA